MALREQRHGIGTQYTLVSPMQIWALNEATAGSAKGVFREWQDRLNFQAAPLVSNNDDPELLIHIPFDGVVKLKAICIIGTPPPLVLAPFPPHPS